MDDLIAIDFDRLKVGDSVYGWLHGVGKIDVLRPKPSAYPIEVTFQRKYSHDFYQVKFTKDGKELEDDINPTLFHKKPKLELYFPPKTKIVNGIELIDLSFQPKHGEAFVTPNLGTVLAYIEFKYDDLNNSHKLLARRGLCYPFNDEGIEVARKHGEILLGISIGVDK